MTVPMAGDTNAAPYQAMNDPLNAVQTINQAINDQLGAVMGQLAQLEGYGTNTQPANDPLSGVMEHLAQLGVDGETIGQVQQAIEQVVKNGADPNQVANELGKVLQAANSQGVKDPGQIIPALAQTLQKIDVSTAESKFSMITDHLKKLGVDDKTLQQMQQAVGQVVAGGVDPNQLTDAMIGVLKSADQQGIKDPKQILPALGQVLEQAGEASGKDAQQAP